MSFYFVGVILVFFMCVSALIGPRFPVPVCSSIINLLHLYSLRCLNDLVCLICSQFFTRAGAFLRHFRFHCLLEDEIPFFECSIVLQGVA